MHRIALLLQQLRQVAAVLPGDAGDQGNAASASDERGADGQRLGVGD